MALDASIYGNVAPPQPIALQNPMDVAQKAMSMAQLGMQYQQTARQMQTQAAIQSAYMRNTDPTTGKLDQDGVLSELGKTNPMAAQQVSGQFAQANEAKAKAQSAQVDAAQKTLSYTVPAMHYLAGMPEDQRAAAYPEVIKQIKAAGAPIPNMPDQYDPGHFSQVYSMTDAIGTRMKDYLENQKTQAGTEKDLADAAKTRSETIQRIPDSLAGDDPAKMVAGRVPKDLQAKAFEEIKNAKDINALSPKIMAAFEKGSSRNPLTAAQGQREFEGLINTTVKETEGTARQAAFDSIHKTMTPSGTLAAPGENDSKARTVLEYLQSKAAAPITGGHGIDLTKYASTSPYQPPSKSNDAGGGPSLGGQTANAASVPPAPAGTILMRAPNGKLKYIPQSQKGEAIAAGGSVVK